MLEDEAVEFARAQAGALGVAGEAPAARRATSAAVGVAFGGGGVASVLEGGQLLGDARLRPEISASSAVVLAG